MRDNGLHTPDGFRDYLAGEYAFKKRTEDGLEAVFQRYAYSSVCTPTLEYAEVFTDKGSVDPKQMYRFIDRDGEMLALRADLTPSVARVVATNFGPEDTPLRFCYVQNVFRYSPNYQGRLREITQAGIELTGPSGDEADAEVLAVAIDALRSSGLEDFRIDVGQVRFLQGMLETCGLAPAVCDELRDFVVARDFVAAEAVGREHDAPLDMRRLLSNLPFFNGEAEILDEALEEAKNEKSRAAVVNLKNIHATLKDYGFEKYVSFDLSMAGNMDYYTGIIFRGYTSGLGFSILDGGRYDGLVARFGVDLPSVGFIIKVHNLVGALEKQNRQAPDGEADVLVAWTPEGRRFALASAAALRRDGLRCANSLAVGDAAANLRDARRRGIPRVLWFDGTCASGVTLWTD
ncbi:MAG: ATP phosphoribosyltransferase regulatory subunit [Synergistaceae bacterium]|jgi:ATP phosphoribosyltransferase regulatory subunit|nr:ATP phosphoribosyltransferase regulatory subunit [Synergistaceae bacterium]